MQLFRSARAVAAVVMACGLTVALSAQTPAPAHPKKKPLPKAPAAPAQAAPKAPEPPPATDVRLHTRMTTGAQVSENTTLIQGERQRVEFPGITAIAQCDLHRTLQINDQSKHYMVVAHAAEAPPATGDAAQAQQQAAQQQTLNQMGLGPKQAPAKGGVIVYTTTATDTGERKDFFGRQARHVKTVMASEASEAACNKTKQHVEVDAWYLDVPPTMAGCTPKAESKAPEAAAGQCIDRVETRVVGDVKLGFPVLSTTTTTVGDGPDAEVSSVKIEVDKFEVTRLEHALFDVPDGYTEVATYQDLLPSVASGGTLADALLGSVADGTRQVGEKDAGAIRIGVPEPVNKSGRDLSARQLQDELVGNFTKWPYQAVPLYGSTTEELQKDAQAKECDHILVSTVLEAKTSHPSKAGGFLKAVTNDGGPSKDNHDIKMDYKLVDVATPDKVESTATQKTSSGGGFGLKSALKLAAFAGQMYMGFGMNRMMMGQFGGALGATNMLGGGAMGMFNPSMGAMNMVMSGASSMAMTAMAGGAGKDASQMQSDQAFRQTMSKALDNVSAAVTATLNKDSTVAKR